MIEPFWSAMLHILLPLSATLAAGTMLETRSVTQKPAPVKHDDSPDEARGRRTLSTAFVRIGAGGHLSVDLRDGRTLTLRDVTMRARDFCGIDAAGKTQCGGYADVVAARPVG